MVIGNDLKLFVMKWNCWKRNRNEEWKWKWNETRIDSHSDDIYRMQAHDEAWGKKWHHGWHTSYLLSPNPDGIPPMILRCPTRGWSRSERCSNSTSTKIIGFVVGSSADPGNYSLEWKVHAECVGFNVIWEYNDDDLILRSSCLSLQELYLLKRDKMIRITWETFYINVLRYDGYQMN